MKRSYKIIIGWLRFFAILATVISVIFFVSEMFLVQKSLNQTDRIFVFLFIPSVWTLYFGAKAWFAFLTKIAR